MNVHSSSKRIDQVQAPMIPLVGEWIAQCPGTISLGQGVVHFAPPAEVGEAVAKAAIHEPRLDRYGLVRGGDELLDAIAKKVESENGIRLDDCATVVATAGSNMGFLNSVLAIGDTDDEIILLSPFYFNHDMAIEIAGCRTVVVPTDCEYQIDLPAVRNAMTDRTRAVVTVSPCNPTGAVYSVESLTELNELCRSRGIYHISDEAYENFVYGGQKHFSPGSLPDSHNHTISLFSLSKAYGMAGWRTGYMVIPSHLETSVKKIQDTNLICSPIVTQVAALAALRVGSDWCVEKTSGFSQVRDLVVAELGQLGDRCRIPKSDGAFYALIQLETDQRDIVLVEKLIREFGIAVMPGSTFGVKSGCSLRVAFGALDRATVAEGIGRLVRGLDNLIKH